MKHLLLVSLGGALGAGSRHLVGQMALRNLGPEWPYGTFAVNVIGGLAMGVLVGWLALAQRYDATEMRLMLGVGLLGGFTTFSAFSLEVVLMIERKAWAPAGAYVALSVLGAVGALMVGLWLGRRLFG